MLLIGQSRILMLVSMLVIVMADANSKWKQTIYELPSSLTCEDGYFQDVNWEDMGFVYHTTAKPPTQPEGLSDDDACMWWYVWLNTGEITLANDAIRNTGEGKNVINIGAPVGGLDYILSSSHSGIMDDDAAGGILVE